MKQAVLSNFDLPWIPLTGLLVFVVCFALYTYWTFKKENKSLYQAASLIPLDEPTRASLKKGEN
jgi:cbb3-type cytochrome oxidase subunit 3